MISALQGEDRQADRPKARHYNEVRPIAEMQETNERMFGPGDLLEKKGYVGSLIEVE